MEFIRGDVALTPRLLLTLIRHLPEGARYTAAVASAPETAAVAKKRNSDKPDPIADHRTWSFDRQLMAQLINSVNALVRHSIQWEKTPELPIVGPNSWTDAGPAKPLTVMDVLNKITR